MSYLSSLLNHIEKGTPIPSTSSKANQSSDISKSNVGGIFKPSSDQQTSTQSLPSKRKTEETSRCLPPNGEIRTSLGTGSTRIEPNSSVKSIPRVPAHVNTTCSSKPPQSAPALPPKKGSYKEIMARAEAAKASQASLGRITHKAHTTLSRRDREKLEAQAKAKAKADRAMKDRKIPESGRRVDRSGAISKPKLEMKVKKPRPELEYKGTARPNGIPARPGLNSRTSTSSTSKKRMDDFIASDEEEEEEDDYGSGRRYKYVGSSEEEDESNDDSDDMGGGGFAELEEEEERSLHFARQEDARALREENEHKQAKLERKKKLEQLAAKSSKRTP